LSGETRLHPHFSQRTKNRQGTEHFPECVFPQLPPVHHFAKARTTNETTELNDFPGSPKKLAPAKGN
jgi:hypothetical protein